VGTVASSRDIAQYLLDQHGPMETWKLQKLVYYVQAWHLALHDRPAYDDQIEAFVDGPVARDLFCAHQNQRVVRIIWKADASRVTDTVRAVAGSVWEAYGDESGEALRELSHAEPAWLEAREGLKPNEPSDRPLSTETMKRTTRQYLDALRALPQPHDDESVEDYLRRVGAAQ
jgi:uncharacterized phage-associated protein